MRPPGYDFFMNNTKANVIKIYIILIMNIM